MFQGNPERLRKTPDRFTEAHTVTDIRHDPTRDYAVELGEGEEVDELYNKEPHQHSEMRWTNGEANKKYIKII